MLVILLACAVSAVAAALLCMLLGSNLIKKYSKSISLIAVGFLVTLSIAHIIPEAMSEADPHKIGLTTLAAILALSFFEMLFGNNHNHGEITEKGAKNAIKNGAGGILFGSLLHTFCDGLVIASAFLASPTLGFAVTIAVLSHEIAHELGDYAIMLDCGMTYRQAFIVNLVAFTGCVSGGICGYFILSKVQSLIPYALALSGASLVYVALSDLLPRLRKCDCKKKMLFKIFYILIGVALSLLVASHD